MNKIASLLRRDPAEIQGAYYVATGVWPVVHLRSFEWATGPKLEGWLVKAVGGLIAAIGTTLFCAARRDRITPELRTLAVGSALWLLGVEVYYAARRRISPVHLGDAVIEAALITAHMRRMADNRGQRLRARQADWTSVENGRSDILPGESCDGAGGRDKVIESSMESFPASDPPAYSG